MLSPMDVQDKSQAPIIKNIVFVVMAQVSAPYNKNGNMEVL